VPESPSEGEDQRESVVDGALLVASQTSGRGSEALRIHNDRLFDQDARAVPSS